MDKYFILSQVHSELSAMLDKASQHDNLHDALDRLLTDVEAILHHDLEHTRQRFEALQNEGRFPKSLLGEEGNPFNQGENWNVIGDLRLSYLECCELIGRRSVDDIEQH